MYPVCFLNMLLKSKILKNLPLYVIIFVSVLWPQLVFANPVGPVSGTSTAGNGLCVAAYWFHGNAGKGLAILSVIILGILALHNQIKWSTAVVVGVGISVLFNADAILTAFGFHTCKYYGVINGVVQAP